MAEPDNGAVGEHVGEQEHGVGVEGPGPGRGAEHAEAGFNGLDEVFSLRPEGWVGIDRVCNRVGGSGGALEG